MRTISTVDGTRVSYDSYGSGPPLVLIHGGFSDHCSNWEFVRPMLEREFRVYAMARRGRGVTDATGGHSLRDEILDAVALIETIGEPVFLLGHSYGAHVAAGAAAAVPDRVGRLVLYEPPWPRLMSAGTLEILEALGRKERWDAMATTFFRDSLFVPAEELERLKATPEWEPILTDAKASLGDLRALHGYEFDPAAFGGVRMPVLLQVGSESPRRLYATDALADVLPDARVEELQGQAHEGMTTAPKMYADAVRRFLLGADASAFRAVPGAAERGAQAASR